MASLPYTVWSVPFSVVGRWQSVKTMGSPSRKSPVQSISVAVRKASMFTDGSISSVYVGGFVGIGLDPVEMALGASVNGCGDGEEKNDEESKTHGLLDLVFQFDCSAY